MSLHLCRRNDDAENTPISVDVKNIKKQEAERLLQIRTSPPTPQCFSATRGPPPKALTPPKPFKPRPLVCAISTPPINPILSD